MEVSMVASSAAAAAPFARPAGCTVEDNCEDGESRNAESVYDSQVE
jgi:hypothetical protein